MTFGTGESLAQENFVEWSMSLDNESSTKHVSSGRIENFLDITRKDNDDAAMLALFRSKKGKGDSTINISVDQGAMNLSNQIGEQLREAREEDANASKITAEQMTVRLCSIDDIYETATDRRKLVPHDPTRILHNAETEMSTEGYGSWVLVLRRVFLPGNRDVKKTKLDIKSPLILTVLKEVIAEERATLEAKASIHWPNDRVYRHREKVREAAARNGTLAVKHVNVLMDLVEKEYAGPIKDINDMFPKGTTTFDILREAFWPGDIVIKEEPRKLRTYRLTDVQYHKHFYPPPPKRSLQISAEYIDCNGDDFGTVKTTFEIDEFSGIRFINQLDLFPLKYHPDQDTIRQRLLERGKKFVTLKGQHYKMYQGLAKDQKTGTTRLVNSRVMIDTAAYNHLSSSYNSITISNITDELCNGELADEHLLICTDRIPFFPFQDKSFHVGSVQCISEVVFSPQVFDNLVLPQTTKDLVRVLVENHSKGAAFDDFVEGKGRGLVLLLHGPPGVGKTMTVEAVTELTKRPLYAVTSGELGVSLTDIEKVLRRVLEIAKTFRAVVLLDEADVFLEQRTSNNLERNALVSIFLRQIEYFAGIMFLTTNLVETFDQAFHSRIHISLAFSSLDIQAREQIWRNFARNMLEDLEIAEEEYTELARSDLNGRQIKNVFGSSKSLAADQGQLISMVHLRNVLQITTSFKM